MTGRIGVPRQGHYKKLPTMRLFNQATGKFLHASGKGETTGTDYAWCGRVEQARALKEIADEWPYSREPMAEKLGMLY